MAAEVSENLQIKSSFSEGKISKFAVSKQTKYLKMLEEIGMLPKLPDNFKQKNSISRHGGLTNLTWMNSMNRQR